MNQPLLLRLLLVEDDRVDQRAFERWVMQNELPYTYTIASSIRQALERLEQESFDVILIDHDLGGETAFDLLEVVGETPVILVTGTGNEEIAARAMKAGAADYLIKDRNYQHLKLLPTIIETVMRHKQAEVERHALIEDQVRSQVLTDLIRDMSHDLRTPLTGMSMALYMLDNHSRELRGHLTAAAPLTAVMPILDELEARGTDLHHYEARMEKIVTDLIEMIALDNTRRLELQTDDLNQVTQDLYYEYASVARHRDLSLTLQLFGQPLPIRSHPYELIRALRHLIDNAMQYTPPGGAVELCTTGSSTMEAVFEVQDSGVGIPPDDLPRIFDHFYRVDKARGTATGGSGLGLAKAKRIVMLHNGRLWAASEPSIGSRFFVGLPLAL